MCPINKFLALTLVFLVLSSLVMFSVNIVNVYAMDKQPVPQFTVKLVDYSYDVPPSATTTVDQYTGKETTTTRSGHRVEYTRIIGVTIKKQSFTPYTDERGYMYDLYYGVQFKGHFGDVWVPFGGGKNQLNSDLLVIGSEPTYASMYVAGSQLDFRVSASIVGYRENSIYPNYVTDSTSDWSSVQTFTIPDLSPSQTAILPPPSITFDGNQTQPLDQMSPVDFTFAKPFFLLGVSALFGGLVVAVIMVFLKSRLKTSVMLQSSTLIQLNFRI